MGEPITDEGAREICKKCGLDKFLFAGGRVCARRAEVTVEKVRERLAADPAFNDRPLDERVPMHAQDGNVVIISAQEVLRRADLVAYTYGVAAVACAAVRQHSDDSFVPTETFSAREVARAAAP